MANVGSRHNNRYDDSFRKHIRGHICIYCGEISSTKDHFPPATLTMQGLILPCCRECNLLAGSLWGLDFEKRAEYVKLQLKKKYKKYLKAPDWLDEEIQQLGYNLKQGAIEWQQKKDLIKRRLAWSAIDYLAVIDHNNYFAQFNVEIDTIIKVEKRLLMNIKWRREKANISF